MARSLTIFCQSSFQTFCEFKVPELKVLKRRLVVGMQATRKKEAPRLPRPVGRYWKGKAPKGAEDTADGFDSDIEEDGTVETDDIFLQDDFQLNTEDSHFKTTTNQKAINITLKSTDIIQEEIKKGTDQGTAVATRSIPSEEEEEETEEEGEEGETNSSDASDSAESEGTKPAVPFRPVFVPKRARVTVAPGHPLDPEEHQREREKEAEIRRKQSHDLVAESIRRELAEKETEDHMPDVNDTDDLDPTGEFEAWRLRELNRIKRDKEEQFRREEEKAEIERRRALPEEIRLKEDLERAQKSREEKPKGSQKFLQKYWHKGAFHQDLEVLTRHDYTQATESTADVTLLPKIMQVRDYGKRSRTKYTHLLDQDTTVRHGGFGGLGLIRPSTGQGCFLCGGPHLKRDCPQITLGGQGSTGVNQAGPDTASIGNDRSRERDKIRKRHDNEELGERDQKLPKLSSQIDGSVPMGRRRRSKSPPRERDYNKKQKLC